MTQYGMIIDLDTCVGCNACTVACKAENGSLGDMWFAPVFDIELGKFPTTSRVMIPTLCNHCKDAPCMKACPTHAISRSKGGIVQIDEYKCCGSQACVGACPYGAMYFPDKKDTEVMGFETPIDKYFKTKRKKLPVAMKCQFNAHKIGPDGKYTSDPACVITCPVSCRIFGDLDDPESKPNKYIKERKVERSDLLTLRPDADTGPNVLYISPRPRSEHYVSDQPDLPISQM